MVWLRRHPTVIGAVSSLLAAVYLFASLGVIPSPRVIAGWFGHLSSERFPCEECGCGCASARECWTHCCCHTEHQRLMWAIEHGVMPPSIIEFTDAQWIAAANAVKPGSAHCALCVARIKGELRRGIATARDSAVADACTPGGAGKAAGSCCGSSAPSGAPASAESAGGAHSCCAKGGDKDEPAWPGPTISALTCKGLSHLLTMTLPPAPPVRVVELILPEASPFLVLRPQDAAHPSRTLEVPEPPPRGV